MKAITLLLIAALVSSPCAHAQSELDVLAAATADEVQVKVDLRKLEINQLKAEADKLQGEIDFVKKKVRISTNIRNATFVISIGLAATIGVVLKRNVLTWFRANPIGVRIVGTLIAATGAAASGAAYGHYLVQVETKDLEELQSRIIQVKSELDKELTALDGGAR